MKALHRRWKLAVLVAVPVSAGAACFFPLLSALAAGLLAGIGLVLLLESLDQTIKTVADVHAGLGLTVLGVLPQMSQRRGDDNLPERHLITRLSPENPVVDAYRRLDARLQELVGSATGQVIMVTSCIPGEGKSTVSGNLAVTLGRTGARVLLVGCDLRRPSLGGMFEQPEEPGLTELLADGNQAALRQLTGYPLDFMPGGGIPMNPAELLDSKPMKDFLEYARARYDFVVLDAPPVLPVTDSQVLAPLCDVLLAVVEPCRTQFGMAQQMVESLQAVGEKLDGVVLNDKSGLAARYYGLDKAGSAPMGHAAAVGRPLRQWGYRFAGVAALTAVVAGGGYLLSSRHTGPAPVSGPLPSIPPVVTEHPTVPAFSPALPKVGADSAPLPVVPKPQSLPTVAAAPVRGGEVSSPPQGKAAIARDATAIAVAISDRADTRDGLQPALAAIGKVWQEARLVAEISGGSGIEGRFARMGLRASALDHSLAVLLQLNTPLLLEVDPDKAGVSWLAVVGRKGFSWQVSPSVRSDELLSEAELRALWTGRGYLPWRDPLGLMELEAGDAGSDRIAGLQRLLVKTGCLEQFSQGALDRETMKAIGRLQADRGLPVNGRLTPETLILLYQAEPSLATPKFTLWQ